jgi:hypothetical protein
MQDYKSMFLAGFFEGAVLQATVDGKSESVHLPGGYLIGDLVRLIDEFYSDQANIRLPILDGVVWATMNLRQPRRRINNVRFG